VLCSPLVAGCGAATRVDFAPHSRPASPIEVSVYVGAGGIQLDPTKLTPGPVQFNITNQSGKAVSLAVMISDGRTVSTSPSIPSGATAEMKTTLSHHSFGVGFAGHASSMKLLTLTGRARTGNGELTQP
jgi:hypothetical protein